MAAPPISTASMHITIVVFRVYVSLLNFFTFYATGESGATPHAVVYIANLLLRGTYA